MEWFEKWVNSRTYQWESVPAQGASETGRNPTANPNQ
jgi:hypothetical protein